MNPGQRILIGGGVRSGKSAFALSLAQGMGQRRVFVATAQAFDDEMRRRIDAHRRERANDYLTVDAPLDLPETLTSLRDVDVVVVDCLTLWLSNMLLADMSEARIGERVAQLQRVLRSCGFHSIIVTNEVGMGIVPDNALGRLFRDISGRAHQVLAASSNTVYMAMLGMMLRLHPAPVEIQTRASAP